MFFCNINKFFLVLIFEQIRLVDLNNFLTGTCKTLVLDFKSNKTGNYSLMSGFTGYAFILNEIGYFINSSEIINESLNIIDYLSDKKIGNSQNQFTMANGLTGYYWLLAILNKEKVISVEYDFFEEFDNLLENVMRDFFKLGNYDFFHGGLGMSTYLLNRKQLNSVQLSIELLYDSAIIDNWGIRWYNSFINPKNIVNLGPSHGVISIGNYLLNLIEEGINNNKVITLIEGLLKYLMNVYNQQGLFGFPHSISDDLSILNKNEYSNRLAWCYGDLGISLFFAKSYLVLKKEWLKEVSLNLAINTIKRKNNLLLGVSDAGFCHGFVGISYLYNKLFEIYQLSVFEEESNFWKLKTKFFLKKIENLKDFSELIDDPISPGKFKLANSYGLLTGLGGVAVCLLSMEKQNPNFDKFFLL